MKRITPDSISYLVKNEVFVFGSNEAGRHGAGAAKTALGLFGAHYGQPEGSQGQSYAIPTKDKNLNTLSLDEIEKYVVRFLEFAIHRPELTFYVTEIGCGLAGYTPRDIAPCFYLNRSLYECPNIYFPQSFWDCEDKWDEYCANHG